MRIKMTIEIDEKLFHNYTKAQILEAIKNETLSWMNYDNPKNGCVLVIEEETFLQRHLK